MQAIFLSQYIKNNYRSQVEFGDSFEPKKSKSAINKMCKANYMVIVDGEMAGTVFSPRNLALPTVTSAKKDRHILSQIDTLEREIRAHIKNAMTLENPSSVTRCRNVATRKHDALLELKGLKAEGLDIKALANLYKIK